MSSGNWTSNIENSNSWSSIELEQSYGAHNYHPLPLVIAEGEGIWVKDAEGKRYMDMLSAYSALNHGHRHPVVMKALMEQAGKLTLTSRAFYNDVSGRFYKKLAEYTGKQRILAMNSGAEAVETALKAARRWAYRKKGIPENEAEVIVFEGNFHGRTITITSFSATETYTSQFGPFTPGFKLTTYGDLDALEKAVTDRTAAVLIEPIQGEGGIVIPPKGYLSNVAKICRDHNVLLLADEIQTGLGRTGQKFAMDWEHVVPDVYIIGKALGGGVLPVSAIAANDSIMEVFDPGSHGSTFGGNPLACAVALAALEVTENEGLAEKSRELGRYMLNRLKSISSPIVHEIRGRGLFIGVELNVKARPYCERLMEEGLLCKETHECIIRLAPPLVIRKEEIDWAVGRIQTVLERS